MKEAEELGLKNSQFYTQDVTAIPSEHPMKQQKYDLITAFMVIHDLSHPVTVLKAIHDILDEGGVFFMQVWLYVRLYN